MEKHQETAIKFTQELLPKLGIEGEVKLETMENNREYIKISSMDDNILIGYHGQTIDALQTIVNNVIHKEHEDAESVVIDIGGYRLNREVKILEAANKAAEKAKFMEKPVSLFPMTSYERKLVHEAISNLEEVTSASQGEGKDRRVIIYPKRLEGQDL